MARKKTNKRKPVKKKTQRGRGAVGDFIKEHPYATGIGAALMAGAGLGLLGVSSTQYRQDYPYMGGDLISRYRQSRSYADPAILQGYHPSMLSDAIAGGLLVPDY